MSIAGTGDDIDDDDNGDNKLYVSISTSQAFSY